MARELPARDNYPYINENMRSLQQEGDLYGTRLLPLSGELDQNSAQKALFSRELKQVTDEMQATLELDPDIRLGDESSRVFIYATRFYIFRPYSVIKNKIYTNLQPSQSPCGIEGNPRSIVLAYCKDEFLFGQHVVPTLRPCLLMERAEVRSDSGVGADMITLVPFIDLTRIIPN